MEPSKIGTETTHRRRLIFEEHAQNGARRELFPTSVRGARRALCASEGFSAVDTRFISLDNIMRAEIALTTEEVSA